MKLKVCDLCGKTYQKYSAKDGNGFALVTISDNWMEEGTKEEFELCPSCKRELLEWIKRKRERHESNSSALKEAPLIHPGSYIYDYIVSSWMSLNEVCKNTGLDFETLTNLIQEKIPVTISIAMRLSKVFGNVGLWMNLQDSYERKLESEEEDMNNE